MLSQHQALFEPLDLGRLSLKNRVVLAPTYVGMGDLKGNVTDQSLCYYFARAAAEVGLVIVEVTGVTARYAFNPGYGLGAGSDKHLPGLRDLAQVIHWGGAKALIQLLPGQGAQALQSYEGRPLVGPSDVPAPLPKDDLPENLRPLLKKTPEQPRPLTREEIRSLKLSVVLAAGRAQRAGFDGVELHGAHGYLLSQFTSPYFNQRQDDYGGSPEKRWNLSREAIQEIKRELGRNFVVGYRLSAREFISGGLNLPEAVQMARALEEAGADYLSVSHGCYGSLTRIFPRGEGSMTEDAAAVRKNVTIPVMAPNFQDPGKAARAIENGSLALAALSRALLADPLWAKKVREERAEEIRHCIRCYRCVRAAIVDYSPVRCPVNPGLGFERFDPRFRPRPPDTA